MQDTSAEAPAVYRDRKIVDREDFDRERKELTDQLPLLRAYADGLLANAPNVTAAIDKAANKPTGGYVVLNFSGIVSRLSEIDMTTFAKQQRPILSEYAERTADMPDAAEHHRYYKDNAAGMARFLERV